MLEPSLTSQLLGAWINRSYFLHGRLRDLLLRCEEERKEQRKQTKINELLEIQKGYEQEIKSSVWDNLAEHRKHSVSDNDFKTC